MRNIDNVIEFNSKFVNSLSCDEWIKLLKLIVISYLPLYGDNSKDIEAINNIKDMTIHYGEFGLHSIKLMTSKLEYEDFSIELNQMNITISKQKGYAKFEELSKIPIEVLRLIKQGELPER